MSDSAEKLIELNAPFAANSNMGLDEADIFELRELDSPVVLTAPHATKTFVCQRMKAADLFTGAITLYLGSKHRLSTIVRRKYIDETVLIHKFALEKNLHNRFFLDIHGMSQNRDFHLAVGTGLFAAASYKQEILIIKELAEKYKIKMVLNHPDYRGTLGMTRRLQTVTGRPQILQLEWRLDYRDFYNHPDKVLNVTLPFIGQLADRLAAIHPFLSF